MTDDSDPRDKPLAPAPQDPGPNPGNLVGELNDLGPPRLLGNVPRPMSATYVRDLTEADIAALNGPRGAGAVRPLQKLRSSHHALARCLAAGMSLTHAAQVAGYTTNRASLLQRDPLFQSLISEYRDQAKEVMADLTERMINLSLDAIEELQERLNDAPEDFSVATLLDVVKALADRTGHGPNSELKVTVAGATVDRPPRETYEEWQARRAKELGPDPLASMEPATRTPN